MSNSKYEKTVTSINEVDSSKFSIETTRIDPYKKEKINPFRSKVSNSIATTLDLSIFLDEYKESISVQQSSPIEELTFDNKMPVLEDKANRVIASSSNVSMTDHIETLEEPSITKENFK